MERARTTNKTDKKPAATKPSKYNELKSENINLKVAIDVINSSNMRLQEQVDSLSEKLKTCQEENIAVTAEKDRLHHFASRLDCENQLLKQMLDAEKKKHRSLFEKLFGHVEKKERK